MPIVNMRRSLLPVFLFKGVADTLFHSPKYLGHVDLTADTFGDIGMEKQIFFKSDQKYEDGGSFVFRDDGILSISVAEEKAVDTHNEVFICCLHLKLLQAQELRDWLCDLELPE